MAKLMLGTREITPVILSNGIPRSIENNTYRMPSTLTEFKLPASATTLGDYALAYAFRGATSLTSIDLSHVTTLNTSSLVYAFYGCTGLTGIIDLSGITTANKASGLSYTFYGCTGITGLNLSNLTTVTATNVCYQIARGCSNLESVDFSNLTQIGTNNSSGNYGHFSYAFYGTKITELRFPKLTAIYSTGGSTASYGTFSYNNKLKKIYFPKVTTINYGSGASSANQASISNMFSNCAALTEIHFAAVNQAAIEAAPGYSTAWASSATIYFDL